MARIPEEVIDQVRNQADIVDIIGNYVQLKNKDVIILAYVLSTVKKRHPFLSHQKNRCSIVLVVVREGMFFLF